MEILREFVLIVMLSNSSHINGTGMIDGFTSFEKCKIAGESITYAMDFKADNSVQKKFECVAIVK